MGSGNDTEGKGDNNKPTSGNQIRQVMGEVVCQVMMKIRGQRKEINQVNERGGSGAGRRKDVGYTRVRRDRRKNNGEGRLQIRRLCQSRGRWQRRRKEHRWRYNEECRNNVPKIYEDGKVRIGDNTERSKGYGGGGWVELQRKESTGAAVIETAGDKGERTERAEENGMESAKGKTQGCASTGKQETRGTKRIKTIRRSDRGREQSHEKEKQMAEEAGEKGSWGKEEEREWRSLGKEVEQGTGTSAGSYGREKGNRGRRGRGQRRTQSFEDARTTGAKRGRKSMNTQVRQAEKAYCRDTHSGIRRIIQHLEEEAIGE